MIDGNITAAVSTIDSVITIATTLTVKTLVFVRLTHVPRTALSLHSSSRNNHRAGQQHPARACTPKGEQPQQGTGDQHDGGRAGDQGGVDGLEALGLLDAVV